MRTILAIAILMIFVTGCLVGRPPAQSRSIGNQAHAAQLRGDWAEAALLWEQAIRTEQGIWSDPEMANSPKRMTVYYYELGRSLGVLGEYDEGEKDLLEALRLDKKLNGPIGMDLTELARLNHARGDNVRADFYFKQILPRVGEVEEQDPCGAVALYTEAASVARTLGQNDRAAELEAKAAKISEHHPNLKFPDDYGWTPYKTSTVTK